MGIQLTDFLHEKVQAGGLDINTKRDGGGQIFIKRANRIIVSRDFPAITIVHGTKEVEI